MAKTPFNSESELRFNNFGLRRLGLCKEADGNVIAFDIAAIKAGMPPNAENSVVVFKAADIKPEALELLMSAPLLWRALFAANMGTDRIGNLIENMQNYLLQQKGVQDESIDFVVRECGKIQDMLLAAMNVPVMGRDAAIKNYQAPDENNG